jgi:hypothetical protein
LVFLCDLELEILWNPEFLKIGQEVISASVPACFPSQTSDADHLDQRALDGFFPYFCFSKHFRTALPNAPRQSYVATCVLYIQPNAAMHIGGPTCL